jgi:hypothetical protein
VGYTRVVWQDVLLHWASGTAYSRGRNRIISSLADYCLWDRNELAPQSSLSAFTDIQAFQQPISPFPRIAPPLRNHMDHKTGPGQHIAITLLHTRLLRHCGDQYLYAMLRCVVRSGLIGAFEMIQIRLRRDRDETLGNAEMGFAQDVVSELCDGVGGSWEAG